MTYKINVYKLWWDSNEDLYVGSTKSKLCYRAAQHRNCANNGKMTNVYVGIRKNGIGTMKYGLLESYEVSSRDEQLKYEREWQDKLKPSLNMYRALVTKKEKAIKLRECERKYTKNNTEKILAK